MFLILQIKNESSKKYMRIGKLTQNKFRIKKGTENKYDNLKKDE